MTPFQAVALSVLQGATEFLPVSSSGHLVLLPWLLGWAEPGLIYDAVVHLGTLVAVAGYFRRDLLALARAWLASVYKRKLDTPQARMSWLLLASTLPGALLGFALEGLFQALFGAPRIVALFLILTGLLLTLGEYLGRGRLSLAEMGLGDALLMGLAQGCAIAPGLSRSGATIAVGLLRGLSRAEAARFSFLMALPITLGAAGVQFLHVWTDPTPLALAGTSGLELAIGFVGAALSGLLAIRFLLAYLVRRRLRSFAYYCWGLGIVCFVLTFLR
ncbi:MAG: undecaprenyl-diphosphate phosphatase [Chloroflexi bacterium]|nr:undecaprenyl-diphosphate phosphatase [Chloroflexota bacterium]